MNCKRCKREIPENSIFCNWCGQKIIKSKNEVALPKPTRLKSGEYSGQIMIDGVRHRVRAPSAAAYYAELRALKAEVISVKQKVDSITLSEAIDKYVESRRSRLRTTTIENYNYIKRCRFKSLMKMKIGSISQDDVDEAVEAELRLKSRKGGTISPDTVNDAYRLIATVLNKYAHLSLDVDLPEEQRKFPVVLPPEQIFPAIKGTDIELPCLLAMWLGMSASEIRGLTKSKSIRDDKLFIIETVVRVDGKDVRRQGGKEETRPRCYDIPPYIKSLIDMVDTDVIEPRTAHALNQRLQTEISKAGLPHITFHSLRHTSASVMAQEKIPTIYSQERGGWKTDMTMKKVYQHTFDEGRLAADKVINDRFEKLISDEIT